MVTRKGSDNRFPLVRLTYEDDTPATPATGEGHLVAGVDKVLRWIDDDGIVTEVGGGAVDYGETGDIVTQAYDDTPDAGALDEVARADHRHGMPSAGGGGGSDPTKPGTATDWAGGSFTGWTDLGTVTKDIGTTRGDALYLEIPNNSGIAGIHTALSMPATIRARLDVTVVDVVNNTAGIMVCESSPGRIVYLGVCLYGASDYRVVRRLYTDPTTYSSEATAPTIGTLPPVRGHSIWLELAATSSSNITSRYSYDGTHWYTLESGLNSGGTIARWGYYGDRNSASAGSVKLASPWYSVA